MQARRQRILLCILPAESTFLHVTAQGAAEEASPSRAVALSPRLFHIVIAPLLLTISAAELFVTASPVLSPRVLL